MQTESSSKPPADKSSQTLSDPERWVELYGDYLFKFALVRLRDATLAEDAVQETFLAALKGGKSFAGRAAEKTWLAGILKNKIYDHFRKAGRETSFTNLEFYSRQEGDEFVPSGSGKGAWQEEAAPLEWPNPGEALDNGLFWEAYHACAEKLPRNVAAAFNLREVDGIDSKEVCSILGITDNNLWVMLHRARLALRRCLEQNWFGKIEPAK